MMKYACYGLFMTSCVMTDSMKNEPNTNSSFWVKLLPQNGQVPSWLYLSYSNSLISGKIVGASTAINVCSVQYSSSLISGNFIGKIVGANTAINVCSVQYSSNLISGNFIGKIGGGNTAIYCV